MSLNLLASWKNVQSRPYRESAYQCFFMDAINANTLPDASASPYAAVNTALGQLHYQSDKLSLEIPEFWKGCTGRILEVGTHQIAGATWSLSFEGCGGHNNKSVVFFKLTWLGWADTRLESLHTSYYHGVNCLANFTLQFSLPPACEDAEDEERHWKSEYTYDGSYIFTEGITGGNIYIGLILGHHLDPSIPMLLFPQIRSNPYPVQEKPGLVLVPQDGAARMELLVQVLDVINPALQY